MPSSSLYMMRLEDTSLDGTLEVRTEMLAMFILAYENAEIAPSIIYLLSLLSAFKNVLYCFQPEISCQFWIKLFYK